MVKMTELGAKAESMGCRAKVESGIQWLEVKMEVKGILMLNWR